MMARPAAGGQRQLAVIYAVLAAVFYGISVPVSKLLLNGVSPVFLAALLYLGAGIGMIVVNFLRRGTAKTKEARITRQELPFTAAMVVLDIAAPILLMFGLSLSSPATVSLLGNFEIVATAVVALVVFKEAVGKRMWVAIVLITLSSLLLSVADFASLRFSLGALLVLLGCLCWGIENNCTRMLSLKDPVEIVIIKGLGAGCGSLLIAAITGGLSIAGGFSASLTFIGFSLLLGFLAYGLSIYLYIMAQRNLGATRTSVFFAFSPFIGTLLSLLVFRERPTLAFILALAVMLAGAYFAVFERHGHEHEHEYMEHDHCHSHDDGHHNHVHEPPVVGEHCHMHVHEPMTHSHPHAPDLHHVHSHKAIEVEVKHE